MWFRGCISESGDGRKMLKKVFLDNSLRDNELLYMREKTSKKILKKVQEKFGV